MTGDRLSFVALLRRGLAVALLLALAVCLAVTLRPAELARRWHLLLRAVRSEPVPAAENSGFWFDPTYAAFLEEVKARTPEEATVAVLAPRWPDVYRYQAAYQLAPRRVVDAHLAGEAPFVATYRTERGPGGEPVAHGTLLKR